MKRSTAVIGALTLGLGMALAAPTAAGADEPATLYVPDDFAAALSDTRPSGHYDVVGTSLRVWTDDSSRNAKVAEYVATDTPLAGVGEPTLEFTRTSGTVPPGYQLVVDLDADGTIDGVLVGEPTFYGNDWWLSNGANGVELEGAPSHAGGSGSVNHGTLDQWRAAFPTANVAAFGFSLGSGVKGDWVIDAINFAGTRYTFAEHVVLADKNACKNGGWQTSTKPVFKNQGDCVSSFASTKDQLSNFRR